MATIACFPLFLRLDTLTLRDWDESRNAVNALEMALDHPDMKTYLVRQFDGRPDMYETKPPLLTWLQVVSFNIFGYNELAVRIPSVLAALALCLIIAAYFREKLDLPWAGMVAVVVLLTSQGYIGAHVARTGDHDSLLILWETLMLLSFFNCLEAPEKPKHIWLTGLFLLLAILTKSAAPLMMLPGMLVMTIWRRRLFTLLGHRHFWFMILMVIACTMGYYLARESVNPGYIHTVWNNELLPRYTNSSATYEYHDHGFGYYLHLLLKDYRSYLILAIIGTMAAFAWLKGLPYRFFFYMLVNGILFFVLISLGTHNFWYCAPLFPVLAIIIALGIHIIIQKVNSLTISTARPIRYAALFAVGVLLVLKYQRTVNSIIGFKDNSSEVQFGYVFRELHKHPDIQRFDILFPDYSPHPRFYMTLCNKAYGYHIGENRDPSVLRPGDRIMATKGDFRRDIRDYYYSRQLIVTEGAYLVEITGYKNLPAGFKR